ncbi:MAG: insulinase family protein, partial [Pseudonocardia sp.]|nr:insulinase family protein [Pseudonocardia sp.]
GAAARAPSTSPGLVLRSAETEQAHLMLGMPGLVRDDEHRVALEVLNTALGGGLSSRLFQEVREQRGLAYSVYSCATSYADAGQFVVYAGCLPERLGEVAEVTRRVLSEVAEGALSEAEVARAKGAMRGGLVLGLEDTGSRMNRIGRHELDHGRQRSLRESLDKIEAVDRDEVTAVAAEVLTRPLTAAVVGPYRGADELPPALARS